VFLSLLWKDIIIGLAFPSSLFGSSRMKRKGTEAPSFGRKDPFGHELVARFEHVERTLHLRESKCADKQGDVGSLLNFC